MKNQIEQWLGYKGYPSKAKTLNGAKKAIGAVVYRPITERGIPAISKWGQKIETYQRQKLEIRADKIANTLNRWTYADVEETAGDLSHLAVRREICGTLPSSARCRNIYKFTHPDQKPKCEITNDAIRNGAWWTNRFTRKITLDRDIAGLDRVIGGLVTVSAKKIGQNEYAMTWATSGRGNAVNFTDGFLLHGYHVPGGDLDAARKTVTNARKKQMKFLVNEKAKKLDLKSIWVDASASLKAGNCPAGTTAVAKKIKREYGDIAAIRADALLEIDHSVYAQRAVLAAANR